MSITPDPLTIRRADIDAKQAAIAPILEGMEVEALILLMPAHVTWFTAGMNVRGMFADSERPGIYTNGKQRWLICSNVDTQRLFDEELDRLGFQLREWHWEAGRSDLLANMTLGKKVIADRPFPNIPMANDHLRPLLRALSPFEQEQYRELGEVVVHAVEATARGFAQGQTEEEVVGQIGHRLLHHGIEPTAVSVAADERGAKYRRPGFGAFPITKTAVVQATGQRSGLYATCSRTVSFGPVSDEFRIAYDLAIKQAGVYRALMQPGATVSAIGVAARSVLLRTPYEFDWRLAPPGYGAGRFPAEELRRAGIEEPLAAGWAVVWQPHVGPATIVDTLIVADGEPIVVTPPEDWPVKRLSIRQGPYHDIPDVLIRDSGE
jgi:Xaa-Pro aminopeptidase